MRDCVPAVMYGRKLRPGPVLRPARVNVGLYAVLQRPRGFQDYDLRLDTQTAWRSHGSSVR